MLREFFNYETARNTLVMTGYLLLILFCLWGYGEMVYEIIKWLAQKIVRLLKKHTGKESAATKEEIPNE